VVALVAQENSKFPFFPFTNNKPRVPLVLSLHILKEFLLFFFAAFTFFVALFLINQLVVIVRDQLDRNIDIADALLLVFYAMPTFVALSFPFGSFLGVLLAVSKLAHDKEIMAAQASGFSLTFLLTPLFIISIGLGSLSFFVNDYLLPLGNLRYMQVFEQLAYSNSELLLEAYSAREYDDVTIITGDVQNNVISQLLITDRSDNGDERVISAASARLIKNDVDGGIISLELEDVVIHDAKSQNTADYSVSYAETLIYNILLRNITVNLRNPGPREMSASSVLSLIEEQSKNLSYLEAQKRRRMLNIRLSSRDALFWSPNLEISSDRYSSILNDLDQIERNYLELEKVPVYDRVLQTQRIEYYKKFSIPLGCISLLILGFPLALLSERHGRFFGILIGLVCTAAYWFLLVGGETFALQNPWVNPFLVIMLPNILAFIAGSIALGLRIKR
jgi:lipopolysaccharide export system permease protein